MMGDDGAVAAYQYPASTREPLSPWTDLPSMPSDSPASSSQAIKTTSDRDRPQAEATIHPNAAERFEDGRRQGIDEGRRAEREESAKQRAHEAALLKGQFSSLMTQFASARDQYLRDVEHEVVGLSLAIAARILRREAQMDPLLLTGAVRVALGQLAETTKVNLIVPQAELELWQETMAHIPNLPIKPVLIAGKNLQPAECLLETELGSVDLGVRAQLAEIEGGFFDARGGSNERSPVISAARGK
jgi:flagellar assembly protein FliH